MTTPSGLLVTPVGFDASGNLLPLLLSADGHVLVDGDSPSLFRPTPEAALYKNTSLPAAGGAFTVVTIPAGQVWRLTETVPEYIGAHAPPAIDVYITVPSGNVIFQHIAAASNSIPNPQVVNILLRPADLLVVAISAVNLNDTLLLGYSAERIY